jgi:hypothetical protein
MRTDALEWRGVVFVFHYNSRSGPPHAIGPIDAASAPKLIQGLALQCARSLDSSLAPRAALGAVGASSKWCSPRPCPTWSFAARRQVTPFTPPRTSGLIGTG